jgi:hypothetical protein
VAEHSKHQFHQNAPYPQLVLQLFVALVVQQLPWQLVLPVALHTLARQKMELVLQGACVNSTSKRFQVNRPQEKTIVALPATIEIFGAAAHHWRLIDIDSHPHRT